VGLGLSATTVLRTSFFANVTSPASGIATFFLKPGSAFDPAGDLAAIQPQTYDQWAALYNRYKVNNCKIIMKITGTNVNGVCWLGAAYPSIDSTALATYQAAACQQYAKTTSGTGAIVASGVGAGEGKYLNFDLNHNSVVGVKSDAWDIGALVTADPTVLQFMLLNCFLQNSQAAIANWVVEIDLYQNVTFSQKKNAVDA